MLFKIKKKYIFILLIVILINFISFFVISNLRKKQEKGIYSFSFIPEDRNSYLYFKDFKTVKSQYLKTDFVKEFKDNYVYLDFKYKYSQVVNFLFIKYNLNIEKFFNLIKNDLIIGKNSNNLYLIANIDLKTKIIYSILNILPDQKIKEMKYKKSTISYINKGRGEIYFSVISNYMIIANQVGLIRSMLDAYLDKQQNYKENLYSICKNEDAYIYLEVNNDYNKYRLLPEVNNISVKIDVNTFNADINVSVADKSITDKSVMLTDISVLKYFKKDFGLFYYNSVFNMNDVISTLVNNYKPDADDKEQSVKKREAQNNLKILDNFYNGAYFGLDNLKLLKGYSSIIPGVCTICRLNDKVREQDISTITDKTLNILSFIFDIEEWDQEKGVYEKYFSQDRDIGLIRYEKFYFFVNGRSFLNEISERIKNIQSSLYDKYYEKLKNKPSSFFICLEPETMANIFEPVFKEYLSSRVQLSNDEYENSFGQFFSYMNDKDSIFINITYNKVNKNFFGNLEYVK